MLSITSEEFSVLSAIKLLCCFNKVRTNIPSFERGMCLKGIGDSYVEIAKSLGFC